MNSIRHKLVTLVLITITVAIYAPSINFDFIDYDDDIFVTKNIKVRAGLNLQGVLWAFSLEREDYNLYWQPLTWISFMLDFDLYGMDASGYHITNLVFHTAAALLIYAFFASTTRNFLLSAFLALIFAVHPANVEAVAWVVERRAVLSMFFGAAALLAYARYAQYKGLKWYLAVCFLYALSLLSKPTMVTFPCLLLLLDVWPLKRFRLRSRTDSIIVSPVEANGRKDEAFLRLIIEKLPLFGLTLAYLVVFYLSLTSQGLPVSTESHSEAMRISTAIIAYGKYLVKYLYPVNLSVFYPYPEQIDFVAVAISAFLLLVASALTTWKLSTHPYFFVGWFWYLGTMLPTSGIIEGGDWPAMADRHLYLPHIGLSIIVLSGLCLLSNRGSLGRAIAYSGVSIFVVGLIILTHFQVGLWKDSITLFRHSLAIEESLPIRNNLAGALLREGKGQEAIEVYKEILQQDPDRLISLRGIAQAYGKIGETSLAEQYLAKAAKYSSHKELSLLELGNLRFKSGAFEKAAALYEKALQFAPNKPGILYNLGQAYLRLERIEDAERTLLASIRLDRTNPDAHQIIGDLYVSTNRLEKAIVAYSEAMKFKPGNAELMIKIGTTLGRLNRLDEAEIYLLKARAIKGQNVVLETYLGNIYFLRNDLQKAREAYMNAITLDGYDAQAHFNLALVYKKLGNSTLAQEHFSLAQQLKSVQGEVSPQN